jgi:signal transduction histidine kinase
LPFTHQYHHVFSSNSLSTILRLIISNLPTDKQPHLFERHYHAGEDNVQFSVLGLGLYICAEIVEKYGEI